MAKNRHIDPPDYNGIYSPVDLDELILEDGCTPSSLEENLNVSETIIYDAITLSSCQYWLLKLDVLKEFTPKFRRTIFRNFTAFDNLFQTYFRLQCITGSYDEFNKEMAEEIPEIDRIDSGIRNLNPMCMLGNKCKEWDVRVLKDECTLVDMMVNRISLFLKTSDGDYVNFSHSLFLVEMLSPKFFRGASEAIQLVLLTNIGKYILFLKNMTKPRIGFHQKSNELNVPMNLLHDVLKGADIYTMRVRNLAWRKLNGILNDAPKSFRKVIDALECERKSCAILKDTDIMGDFANKMDIFDWIVKSEGLYESFELDCTLHGIRTTDIYLLTVGDKDMLRFVDGMLDFENDDGLRSKVYATIGGLMRTRNSKYI